MNKITPLLEENIQALTQLKNWMNDTYQACQQIDLSNELSRNDYDAFELHTSRFARACDILLQKFYRTLDEIELAPKGTLLDALNRAEKRGIIDNVEQVRELRDVRNQIAHEYNIQASLMHLLQSVLKQTPILFRLVELAIKYAQKYI